VDNVENVEDEGENGKRGKSEGERVEAMREKSNVEVSTQQERRACGKEKRRRSKDERGGE
jgi:hypothetical protein